MRIPVIQGTIAHRILVNYRVAPQLLSPLLPPGFRPQLWRGFGLAGICLICLCRVRPRGWPACLGRSSENAAHRIAVEWQQDGITRTGVYILRRDTSSWLNALGGGRFFPGVHHHARFEVATGSERPTVQMTSAGGRFDLAVSGHRAGRLPSTSVFADLPTAADFFRRGSVGFSPTADGQRLQGLELRIKHWRVEPLALDEVRSNFFDDPAIFPPQMIAFDCALLMRDVEHEWHARACPARLAATNSPFLATAFGNDRTD